MINAVENLTGLTPRQEDIYKAMVEENILTDGKPITRQRVKENYPSTSIQPRKKKKSHPKSKRKKKNKGCGCK
jgi:hypothetical protein